jgi:hypothetical protein
VTALRQFTRREISGNRGTPLLSMQSSLSLSPNQREGSGRMEG